jgi:hypothetical protein
MMFLSEFSFVFSLLLLLAILLGSSDCYDDQQSEERLLGPEVVDYLNNKSISFAFKGFVM